MIHSKETRKKIGKAFKGKSLSKQHIDNRDFSRIVNSIIKNPLSGIQKLPNGSFRAKLGTKHLACFSNKDDAVRFRIDYISRLYGRRVQLFI